MNATLSSWIMLWVACAVSPESDSSVLGQCDASDLPANYRVASAQEQSGEFANRLVLETSPYLLQHARNPVDWYPWGEEAFAEAKRRNVPIFLSIGYAACHWCHVMEHESFEDPAIAAYMNEHYVSVKVDREERPDVDALYMDVLHMMNSRGGWPASLWLSPDKVPYYAGTYFPPYTRYGRPGFREILERMSEAWAQDPEGVTRTTSRVLELLGERAGGDEVLTELDAALVGKGVKQLVATWDREHAGWGQQNKFPMPSRLEFLLAYGQKFQDQAVLDMVQSGLEAMDHGGIHDHLAGGFHRYTVDKGWVVPHFEKMLYDNAQLLGLYAAAASVLNEPRFAEVARELVRYLVSEMRHESGAFFSSQDADSTEGEGVYYVWTPQQVLKILGPDSGSRFLSTYQVTEEGNFEHGTTVLVRKRGADPNAPGLSEARQKLLVERAERVAPPTDTKRVVAWNGLLLGSLARAGRLLGEPEMIEHAKRCAEAVLSGMNESGHLPRTLESNAPRGVLDDHAFVAYGLLELYEADADPRWLKAALGLMNTIIERFGDEVGGGFFLSEPGATDLLVRQKEFSDGAEPSGASVATLVLKRLRSYGAEVASLSLLDSAVRAGGTGLSRQPGSHPVLLQVMDASARSSMEVVLASDAGAEADLEPFLELYNQEWRPDSVLAQVTPESLDKLVEFGALSGKLPGENEVRAYVCFDGACKLPTSKPQEFLRQLKQRPEKP